MTEERTVRGRQRTRRVEEEPLDPEQAEALSRAAREAVRQPADPRLEKSFAHLGLVPDIEPGSAPAPKRARTRRTTPAPTEGAATVAGQAPPPAAPAEPAGPTELQALLDALAAAQRSTAEVHRRLDVLTWMLAGVIALIGLVALVVIVRGPG